VTPLFDIGANLTHESFADDLDLVLHEARAVGIERLMITGSDLTSSIAAHEMAEEHAGLWSTCGIHPHHAALVNDKALAELERLSTNNSVRAWGEMGLDYFRDFCPREVQRAAFEAQLELASRAPKALFLHERDAFEDFFPILNQYRDRFGQVVVHCFTGSAEALRAYIDLDCHIGITGWVCDERRGQHLLPLIKEIPSDRLLIETDAPYLLPRTLRPKPKSRRCEPKHLVEVCRFLAELLEVEPSALANQTFTNANHFFQIP